MDEKYEEEFVSLGEYNFFIPPEKIRSFAEETNQMKAAKAAKLTIYESIRAFTVPCKDLMNAQNEHDKSQALNTIQIAVAHLCIEFQNLENIKTAIWER